MRKVFWTSFAVFLPVIFILVTYFEALKNFFSSLEQATLALLAITILSPLLVPSYEWARNKIWAKVSFHGWQAVFINTSESLQTYFGHVTSLSKNEITIKDIYYLTDRDDANPININFIDTTQLTKLGEGELHQPEDKMIINKQYVAFMENMTDEAPIMKVIVAHQQKKTKK